ncbi:uncharacterized protein KIAA1143 homolog, partial [Ruditapes philippinarum]|uniref:uncharacterized protein KIAA1143 homolog n=1 Tax=Ruditapes philippinarum TaxID=129788 RepID=UPI00295B015F
YLKREELKYEDEDRSDNEDEKPTIVVLKEGDLTAEEADLALKDDKDDDVDEKEPSDGKITFKKPVKRQSETANELAVSSSKKTKEEKKTKKTSSSKEVKNSSLLSFGDDEDDEET